MRSGVEILSGHPMLYWHDDCRPGSEWLKFSPKVMPKDELWTAEDEKVPWNSWIALPGHDNLGLGRYWHFLPAALWLVTGLVYAVLLFVSPEWRALIPTTWAIFPRAYHAFVTYLHFRLPPEFGLFNALQELTYAAVIFILSPIQILTGLAMSPAFIGRFPGYLRPFGGKQAARSLHFLGLVAFLLFTVVHVAMVFFHGLAPELAKIVLGIVRHPSAAQMARTSEVAGGAALVILLVHILATKLSLLAPRPTQNVLQSVVDPIRHALFHQLRSVQEYPQDQLTPFLRPNGRPPRNEAYVRLAKDEFQDFVFEVGGLVRTPLHLTLGDLRSLPGQVQITKHNCIQGWTQVVSWGGIRLQELLERSGPLPEAHYILFETFDDKWERPGHGYFYGTLSLDLARHPQTILAYDLNGSPLPIPFGAPLRLRVETQLGFKMTKWIRRMALIEDYHAIGEGKGGWREDVLNYSQSAPI